MKSFLAPLGTSVALVLLLAAAGCSEPTAAQSPSPRGSASLPPTDAALDRVSAGHAERKTLQLYTTQPGRIQAFEETPLHPKIAGYVEQVFVDIGDRVAKNQLLVKLAVPEMQDDVEQKVAEPKRQVSPPRGIDRHDVWPCGWGHPFEQLQCRGQPRACGASEREPLQAAQPDQVERGEIGNVGNGSGVSDHDPSGSRVTQAFARLHVLIVNIARRAPEKPELVAIARLLTEEEGRQREQTQR